MNQNSRLLETTLPTAVLRNVAMPINSREVGPQAVTTPVDTQGKPSHDEHDRFAELSRTPPVEYSTHQHQESLESTLRAELTASLSTEIREQLRQELQISFEQELQQKLDEQKQQVQQQLEQIQTEQTDSQRLSALLQTLSANLSEIREQTCQASNPVLWDNAITLACILLGKLLPGLASDPAALQALVNQAISDLQHDHLLRQQSIAIYLHPQDLKALQTTQADWISQLNSGDIRLQASNQVELGGCLASCVSESLDLRLETQLEQIKQAILAWRMQAS